MGFVRKKVHKKNISRRLTFHIWDFLLTTENVALIMI